MFLALPSEAIPCSSINQLINNMNHHEISQQLCIQLGDNTLILAQRLGEWCGQGPVLEQDIALTNIALDLLGQTRMYYAYAAQLEGQGKTEDELAYFRDAHQYKNVLLVEQKNGNWADTIARQFFFDAWHSLYVTALVQSTDTALREIAEKAIKEITYHLRFSSDWVIRLGDGTEESHQKMQAAIDQLWVYTGELFLPSEIDNAAAAAGIAPDLADLQSAWKQKVEEVLTEATLTIPAETYMQRGGKTGVHTEHLGYLLAEMQYLQRAYPGNQW